MLATVKGDVHDIGKNIVGVVLACNGYSIIDLGVMVTAERIVEEVKARKVDIIGLSGLITPSLDEMVHVVRELKRNGITIPVLIGGATTSELHTALKIAPEYEGVTVHVRDASQASGIVANLLNPKKGTDTATSFRQRYQTLRENYKTHQNKLIPIELARKNKFDLNWNEHLPHKPNLHGIHVVRDINVNELIPYIDWTFFFRAWNLKGRYPEILADPIHGNEAQKLKAEAEQMLDEISRQRLLNPEGVFGIFPAASNGDNIILYTDETRTSTLMILPFLRNQEQKNEGEPNLCLADFIAPESINIPDWLGCFAVTAGSSVSTLSLIHI